MMGIRWTQLIERLFNRSEHELRVGMLGLDNAGKTTILHQLKYQRNIQAIPTVGFNVENVSLGKFLLHIWDVSGGQPKAHILWQHYNQQNTRIIIFIIDASDMRRLPLAAEELRWLWWREELAKAPFLIFANKQDLPGALSAVELVNFLGLQKLQQPWAVQECCALTGNGLWDGMQQLEQILMKPRNVTNKIHVQRDKKVI